MMMDVSKAMGGLITLIFILLAFLPLGVWKLFEILYWVYTHIKVEL